MKIRTSFKSDETFLRNLAIGAAGTVGVMRDLQRQGHRPIELEQGSSSYKVWKGSKRKQDRVPDIFCLNCGLRVEARAKTNMEFSMSHSITKPERAWDFQLRDTDYVAFIYCKSTGNAVTDWEADDLVQYVSVGDLREAQRRNSAYITEPKGSQQGSERSIVWPTCFTNYSGQIIERNAKILVARFDGKRSLYTPSKTRKGIGVFNLPVLVDLGDQVVAHQALASVVSPTLNIPCSHIKADSDFVGDLASGYFVDKYAAVKALAYFHSPLSIDTLSQIVADTDAPTRVRLEAAAGLSRLGKEQGIHFVGDIFQGMDTEWRLEAVILLQEIATFDAALILRSVLVDTDQPAEIRAASAWALGEIGSEEEIEPLVGALEYEELAIRIEAARGLAKLAANFTPQLVAQLATSSEAARPGIAWALVHSHNLDVSELLDIATTPSLMRWVAYILGQQDPAGLRGQVQLIEIHSSEISFATETFWETSNSWVFNLTEY